MIAKLTVKNIIQEAKLKTIAKVILIGIITTISRIIGQLLIPAGEQSVLEPSIFAQDGTMQVVFTIYGVFAYSIIAALFLLIRDRMTGSSILKGVKYGIVCSAIWIVYLLEPLPHTAPLDRITYPIIDSVALLIMGVLLGLLLGKKKSFRTKRVKQNNITPVIVITVCFVIARLLQYIVIDIYSSFYNKTITTIIWTILTGFVLGCVMVWFNKYVKQQERMKKAIIVGVILFGVNLTLFNFFMPLVFNADIPDLIMRTVIDFLAITVGCLSLDEMEEEINFDRFTY